MSRDWNLSELYTSFDDPKMKQDQERIEAIIQEVIAYTNEIDTKSSVEIIEGYVQYNEAINKVLSRLRSYANLVSAVDAMNEEASKMEHTISNYMSQLVEPRSKLDQAICQIENLDEAINQANQQQYSFILHEIVKKGQHNLSTEAENVVVKMNMSGSQAWAKLKNQLISTHKVNYKGQMLPLTVVLNEAHSKSREDRKAAYEAEIASYVTIEQSVAAALSNIKLTALTINQMRGYDSLLDETLDISRLSKKTLDAMLSVMKKHRPTFASFYRRKAELLGYSNGLPWYEMYAPVAESHTEYPYEEGCKIVIREFAKFCQEESDFMKHAIENGWIDVHPKEGKRGGAFCSGFGDLNQSRIMLNYGSSYSDVSTLAHELGHGFHSYCMNDEAPLNKHYTMPIAETASTFNEVLLAKSMLKVVSDEDKIAILDASISGDLQVLVDIFSRFIFETNVVNEVKQNGQLSAERVKTLMVESQKEAYTDGLDPNYLHPYMWIWKPHYYSAGLNFYNFPYAFGALLARGLYAMYQKEGPSFAGKYMTFLKNTGKDTIEGIAASVGITLDEEFFEASVQSVEEDIALFMELTK